MTDRERTSRLVREVADKLGRELPRPLFRPGTVSSGGYTGTVLADGDTLPVPYLALCEPPQQDDRIMVLFDDPHGCYAVWHLVDPASYFTARWGPLDLNVTGPQALGFNSNIAWDPSGMDPGAAAADVTIKTIQRTGIYRLYAKAIAAAALTNAGITVQVNAVERVGHLSIGVAVGVSHRISFCDPDFPLVEGDQVVFFGQSSAAGAFARTVFGISWVGPGLDGIDYS